MVVFRDILPEEFTHEEMKDYTKNPYSGRTKNEWKKGLIKITYLQENYGHLETAGEMKNATESEGLKLYFDWLKGQGILN